MFCAGATKSGTSWFHRYLSGHPEAHVRSIKELHYFDMIEAGRFANWTANFERQKSEIEAQLDGASTGKALALGQMIGDLDNWLDVIKSGAADRQAYLDYLNFGRATNQHLIADFTPAYGLLPVNTLRDMGDLSGDVRFTYFLRDPVARLWSHIRMIARRRGGPGSVDPGRAAHILKRTIAGDEPHIAARSDYRAILLRLGEAIKPGKLFIMFYEEMLSTSGIAKICQFLGLRMHEPDISRLVHVGPVLAMTPDTPRRAPGCARNTISPMKSLAHCPSHGCRPLKGV